MLCGSSEQVLAEPTWWLGFYPVEVDGSRLLLLLCGIHIPAGPSMEASTLITLTRSVHLL